MDDRTDNRRRGSLLGVGIAIGAGIGTALFAGADSPVWIGVGAALDGRRRATKRDEQS